MADVAQLRKRVRAAMDAARREEGERRTRAADASRAYDAFLETVAVPAVRQVAMTLKAEGVAFEVTTPSGGVGLVSERRRDDAIAIALDSSVDPPQPLVTMTRVRGSRSLMSERAIRLDTPIASLTEDDVIEMLLEELKPWLT
jgi:hypothetical protein